MAAPLERTFMRALRMEFSSASKSTKIFIYIYFHLYDIYIKMLERGREGGRGGEKREFFV